MTKEKLAQIIYEAVPLRYRSWPSIGEPIDWCYIDQHPDAKEAAFIRAQAVLDALATEPTKRRLNQRS